MRQSIMDRAESNSDLQYLSAGIEPSCPVATQLILFIISVLEVR